MKKGENIILAHDWLNKIKATNKLSYSYLGKFIKYSDVGMSKALKNNTLSLFQIDIIKKGLLNDDEIDSNNSNISNQSKGAEDIYLEEDGKYKFSISEISRFIMYNEDAFFKDKGFKLWFNDHINQAMKKFLEEQGIEVVYDKKSVGNNRGPN
ncbi:MAG: hypothetical protein L3J20_07025 [Flavobacteriaceae bacterium]|nr:hypothetical protein [Flavobacteriaceae bacterium]